MRRQATRKHTRRHRGGRASTSRSHTRSPIRSHVRSHSTMKKVASPARVAREHGYDLSDYASTKAIAALKKEQTATQHAAYLKALSEFHRTGDAKLLPLIDYLSGQRFADDVDAF
jgi:hypothetical protein